MNDYPLRNSTASAAHALLMPFGAFRVLTLELPQDCVMNLSDHSNFTQQQIEHTIAEEVPPLGALSATGELDVLAAAPEPDEGGCSGIASSFHGNAEGMERAGHAVQDMSVEAFPFYAEPDSFEGHCSGIVSSFDGNWGVIEHGKQDVFVHVAQCVERMPRQGDKVRFDVSESLSASGLKMACRVTGGTGPILSKGKGRGKDNYDY